MICRFIATGLIQSIDNALRTNTYFSAYLLTVIDFLLVDRIDSRILFDEYREIFTGYENSILDVNYNDLETLKPAIICYLLENIAKK